MYTFCIETINPETKLKASFIISYYAENRVAALEAVKLMVGNRLEIIDLIKITPK